MNSPKRIADPTYSLADEARDRAAEARDKATRIDTPPQAGKAQRCRCEHPQTYRDDDGDLRCLCGRQV